MHAHTHTHLQPGPHFQQPLLKGWHNPPVSCWPNIQQKIPVAADRGDKLPEKPRGVPEVFNSLSAIIAPRAVLDGEAALPFIRNEATWGIPAGVNGQNIVVRQLRMNYITYMLKFSWIIFHNNPTSLVPKPSGGRSGYETTALPVTPSHVVSNCWGTPPAVDNSDVLHWALIVQPAQKLRRLPVLD